MQEVIEALEKAGLRERAKAMVGGAPLNENFARKIGADACTVIMDLTVEAEAFGAEVVFHEDEVPAVEIPSLKAGRVPECLKANRPVICSEWMNRPAASIVTEILPVFKENNVGSMVWGLVNGKIQTHLLWGHGPEHLPFTGVWQHDLFTSGFESYKPEELILIGQLTGRIK